MKAVMWTDVVQIFLMFAGLIGVIIKGSVDHGGFQEIWNLMYDGDRIEFFKYVSIHTERVFISSISFWN